MKQLNNIGAECMVEIGVNACTDVTGFGLLGHGLQMAQASNVTLKIDSSKVPIFEEGLNYADMRLIPGGTKKNAEFVEPHIAYCESVKKPLRWLLADAQTSGGLLICVDKAKSDQLLKMLHTRGIEVAAIIGEIEKYQGKSIYIK